MNKRGTPGMKAPDSNPQTMSNKSSEINKFEK